MLGGRLLWSVDAGCQAWPTASRLQSSLPCRQQVHDLAASTISSRSDLSSQAAADAVAAIALLDELDSSTALQQFLAGRRHCAEQLLDQALADKQQGGQDAGQVLARLVQRVQSCIAQV